MTQTFAQKFLTDQRVIEAKQSLLSALTEYQKHLTGIKPPLSDIKQSYDDTIKSFEDIRGGKMAFPFLGSGMGRGALVELADGSVKYDFIIGIGVHFFGHSHPELVKCAIDASLSDTIMQGNLQQNANSYEFSKLLLGQAEKGASRLKHCFLTSSGVMAGENALKMAFQKKSPAKRLLCLNGCFMGRTLVMSQTTDNPAYREGLPKVVEVDYVPYFDASHPEESTTEAVKILKKHLDDHPQEYAAMCFELVLGEGGFYPGHGDYFKALMEVLKTHDIPVLVDEVQTFARTTELFAFQHFGLEEYVDAVWIGKASQVCATLFTSALKPKPGLISQTYTASATAIEAGCVVLRHLIEGGYYGEQGKIQKLHQHFVMRLKALSKRHPDLVEGPYGVGAMIAFTPFKGDPDKVKAFINKLYDNGVMTFGCGKKPARVRFLIPAPAIETTDIDVVVDVVEKTLIES